MCDTTDTYPLSALPADVRTDIDDESLILSAVINHSHTYVVLTEANMYTSLEPDHCFAYRVFETSAEMNPDTHVFTMTYATELIHDRIAFDALSTALEAVATRHRELYATPAETDPSLLDHPQI